MDGIKQNAPPPLPPNNGAGLRRVAAAVALSTLLHIGIALFMRPDFQPVNDFAVDFEIVHMTDAPKKPTPPKPEPAPEPTPEPEPPVETPKPEKRPPKITAPDLSLPAPEPEISTDEAVMANAETGTDTDADTDRGGGICMHDLFAYAASEPNWILYVAAAAFRDSVYEKELADTFNSFELGRRLTQMTGMNLTRDVESLFVGAADIFDWRTFQIATSYDFGEETLMARIKAEQKNPSDLKWQKTDDGYTAAIPGQFRWDLVSSGRVMSITHEPEAKKIVPEIPDNPFAADDDTAAAAANVSGTDTGGTDGPSSTAPEATEQQSAPTFPKQVECIAQTDPSGNKKQTQPKTESLTAAAKQLMVPDPNGHWPVTVLSTSDPRAVGLGTRLGRRMGFETAAVRGYFTEPVRIEGYLRFSKDPQVVEALAADWRKDAARFAADPFLAVAGVASLLKNLTITTEGAELRFSLEMNHGQVLSTLLFLQLQGKALERQLMSD